MTGPAPQADARPSGAADPAPRRRGGLIVPPRGELPAAFTLLLTFGVVLFVALVFLPYLLYHGTRSPWADWSRLGFLGFAVLEALLLGLFCAVWAERRDRSPMWFQAGLLGALAAPALAAFGMVDDPRTAWLAYLSVTGLGFLGVLTTALVTRGPAPAGPPPTGPWLHRLGRGLHAAGNIWVGITLLVVFIGALIRATWWENDFGMKAAHFTFYGAWWFGVLLFCFGVSLVSATLRKYPWRFDQVGWLTVHFSLTLLILGSFMSFWGKQEGQIELLEGETRAFLDLATETRMRVDEIGPDGVPHPLWEAIADFDRNPEEREPSSRFTVTDPLSGKQLFDIEVDRYYADAAPRVEQLDDGFRHRPAMAG